jgi:hypothetical protein
MLVMMLAISLCCPILFAVDDEDNDLPDVILPNGGGGGGGSSKCSTLPPGTQFGAVNTLPYGFTHNVALVINATNPESFKVPLASAIAGFYCEPSESSTCLTICRAGGHREPDNPDARILVTGGVGADLDVFVDGQGCAIRDRFTAETTLEEIEAGLFQLTINAGSQAIKGVACFVTGDLSFFNAEELFSAVQDGQVETKILKANAGSVDLSKVFDFIGEDLREEVYDFGIIQVGLNAQNEVVSLTSVIIRAYPVSGICPVDIDVFTTN